MKFVLDCSFCAALFLRSERSPHVLGAFRGITEDDEVLLPVLWWQEMDGVLTEAVRRGLLHHADALQVIRLWDRFRFNTDVRYGKEHTEKLLEIAQFYGLNANSAAYLELAMRESAILGTLSKELSSAVQRVGIKLL
ncbi:type II toxin-antitoxin system VapC family toxin [Breznakiellaceae bacterium SP9]